MIEEIANLTMVWFVPMLALILMLKLAWTWIKHSISHRKQKAELAFTEMLLRKADDPTSKLTHQQRQALRRQALDRCLSSLKTPANAKPG